VGCQGDPDTHQVAVTGNSRLAWLTKDGGDRTEPVPFTERNAVGRLTEPFLLDKVIYLTGSAKNQK
jgi:hypothetical protein